MLVCWLYKCSRKGTRPFANFNIASVTGNTSFAKILKIRRDENLRQTQKTVAKSTKKDAVTSKAVENLSKGTNEEVKEEYNKRIKVLTRKETSHCVLGLNATRTMGSQQRHEIKANIVLEIAQTEMLDTE